MIVVVGVSVLFLLAITVVGQALTPSVAASYRLLFVVVGVSVLFLLAITVVGQALTPSSYFSTVDQARLRAIFEAAQPYHDLASAHYSIMGLQLLGVPVPKAQVSYRIYSISSSIQLIRPPIFHRNHNFLNNSFIWPPYVTCNIVVVIVVFWKDPAWFVLQENDRGEMWNPM